MSSSVSAAPSLSLKDEPRSSAVATVQVITAIALGLAMGLYFWLDSRYPALLKKMHAGHTVKVSAAISFDAVLPVNAGMPVGVRIVRTAGNWLWANRIGMSFGIGFGAAMLTLLPMFSRRRLKSGFGNTLLGVVAGAPLGVCANCVAPIGRGLAEGGASPNTVLATMISSPTLNVVVVAMAFGLFPWQIAWLKVATVVVLLALVPWLSPKAEPLAACAVPSESASSVGQMGRTLSLFLRNLAKMIAITVPLMLLAALLGAAGIELLPASSLPVHVTVSGILLVAVIGTFLPVPMAFDVAVAFVLMSRGVPLPYVVTLLCTLGVFSVYSLLILGRTLTWKTAGKMFAAVMLLGAVAGVATAAWQHVL